MSKTYNCCVCGIEITGREKFRKETKKRTCGKKECLINLRKTGQEFKCSNPECSNVIYRKKRDILRSKDKRFFCSHSCSAKINNLGNDKYVNFIRNKCQNCDVVIRKTSKFCSLKCRHDFYIKNWLSGKENGMKGLDSISSHIRRYLLETRGNKCEKCGWCEVNKFTNKVPVQINHIDGDWKNNNINNLELLCPSCHSLTEFHGSRNKGRGREGRERWRKVRSLLT